MARYYGGICINHTVLKRISSKKIFRTVVPLAGEGGRRPEGGDKKPGFIPLGEPSVFAAWRAQCLCRLAGQRRTPYQSSAKTVKDVCDGMGKTHINKKHLQMAFAMVTIHADTKTL